MPRRAACEQPHGQHEGPKVPAPLRDSVDLDAIPVLLAACQNLRDKLVVSLLADTGLRLSELASLRVGDIDLEEDSIAVWGKGAKQRTEEGMLWPIHSGASGEVPG